MAGIPSAQKLDQGDFRDFEKDFPKLLGVLNVFMSDVVNAFSRRITVKENTASIVRTIEWIEASTIYPLCFPWDIAALRPSDLWITKLETMTGTAPTASGLLWNYDDASRLVKITKVFGLTAGSRYRMRVIATAN